MLTSATSHGLDSPMSLKVAILYTERASGIISQWFQEMCTASVTWEPQDRIDNTQKETVQTVYPTLILE